MSLNSSSNASRKWTPAELAGEDHGLNPVDHLRAVMHVLRAPGGCPWDAEQTHESLIPSLIEEAYEVAQAIRGGNVDEMVDELGDLLLQPVFHAELGAESGVFDLDTIAQAIVTKLIRRHPHVFGDSAADSAAAVVGQWEKIKQAERGESPTEAKPYLRKPEQHLPALLAGQKLQKKMARVGFDWSDTASVMAKAEEELEEVREALAEDDRAHVAEEIGDLLFAVVNVARSEGLDAETLLSEANQKFVKRVQQMERLLRDESALSLEAASLAEMEEAWQSAKSSPGLASEG